MNVNEPNQGTSQNQNTATPSGDAAAAAATAANTAAAANAAPAANAAASAAAPTGAAAVAAAAAADPAAAAAAAAAAPVVPEKYAFTPPEGVTFNTEVLGKFEGLAKELKLPQTQAQQVVNLGAELMQRAAAESKATFDATTAQWEAAAQSDSEFGGAKLDASLATGKAAIAAFGTPEFKQFLEDTRLGSNPEMVRFMYRVGMAMSTDKFVAGSPGAGTAPKTIAQSMYPSMNP